LNQTPNTSTSKSRPPPEILNKRCGIAPSYASKLVAVMRELQRRRQGSNVFAGKHGFITPRDLFRRVAEAFFSAGIRISQPGRSVEAIGA
jgi:hypothetical protein